MKKILKYFGRYVKHVDKVLPVICIAITAFDMFLMNSMLKLDAMLDWEVDIILESMVKTQFTAAVIGIAGAFVLSFIDYKFISKYWFTFAPIAVVLQFLLFVPSLRIKVDDDMAWLRFGRFTLQPSEVLKFVFIITLATHISRLGEKINSLPHLLLVCAHGLFPVVLIMYQGDAGSALVFLFIFICMLFMGGLSWKYLVAGIITVPAVAYFAWNFIMQDHHRRRFQILFDKELQQEEILGDYLQQYQGTIALGSGQLTGLGFDSDKYTYTPFFSNDFVFSYIGMTLGFIGCMAVVIAFAILCLKLLSSASGAPDQLGKLMCVGVFAMVFFHCVINIGMVLSVVPVIGIPLPFISQGGTSMMMTHICMGLVMSVSWHREKPKHMFYTEED
ncbi:MAG: FtsW/RodA/SpoVE family cell cycle protein [Oscillospiraceae bacterium]|nr:FtsW/RodA/SpoVE family cell cycle protein [Oscillospiraceae bacterium]